jgi:SAM-dependent methyltransferase
VTDPDAGAPLVGRYETLIGDGVYTERTRHGIPDRAMVDEVLRPILAATASRPIRVLDCGCGPGEWLEVVAGLVTDLGVGPADLRGFDITPGMVALAQARLEPLDRSIRLGIGDILDAATYGSDGVVGSDLVYAFDVVQQLPEPRRFEAVETMLGEVRPGGTLVVFDHDGRSRYGRTMAMKKWVTRNTPIALVPRWYVHAAYPPLARFAERLAERHDVQVRIARRDDTPRRALVVTRPAGGLPPARP